MTSRKSTLVVLALAVCGPLVALAAISGALLQGLAWPTGAPRSPDVTEPHGAAVDSAEATLWLATAALGALGLGLGLAGLHAVVLGPTERLARRLAGVRGASALAQPALHQVEQIIDDLQRQLAKERSERVGHIEGAGRLRAAADLALEHLDQAERLALVGRIAVSVRHEVGGPLSILVGWLERLRHLESVGAQAEQRQRALDAADHAASQIHRLLADLADAGRPDSNADDRPCDLGRVALRVVAQAEVHPRCRSLHLEAQVEAGPHGVDASASELEQVCLNLVLNAADAVQGVGRVQVQVRRQGRLQELIVDDDGPGIAESERQAIFAPFFTTKERQGWGLGLAVSRRIVERAAGTLEVADSPLGGARFCLRLAAHSDDQTARDPRSESGI